MIIDSHVHLTGPPYTSNELTVNYPEGGSRTLPFTRESYHPDNLLKDMEASGTEKAVVVALPDAITNNQLFDIMKRYKDKFIGFAGVRDPKKSESVTILEKAVKEQNMMGLKLHPDLQSFSPSDPEIIPLIEKTVELDVPVLFHSRRS